MRTRTPTRILTAGFILVAVASSQAQAGPMLDALSREIASIVTEVSAGVVDIKVESEQVLTRSSTPFGARGPLTQQMGTFRRTVQATGFFLDDQGHIMTTAVALEDADEVQVTLHDGRSLTAEIVGVDTQSRIGVLRVPTPDGVSVPKMATSCPDIGSLIIAFGNQAGLNHSPAFGVVSAKRRSLSNVLPGYGIIQITAPITAGMAGGPVVNSTGEVIGMICATYLPQAPHPSALHSNQAQVNMLTQFQSVSNPQGSGYQSASPSAQTALGASSGVRIASNVGFALPALKCLEITDRLIAEGHINRPWLGVRIGDVPPEVRKHLHLGPDEGVFVQSVVQDSPAGRVGIQSGDILLRINDTGIASRDEIVRLISRLEAGDSVTLSLIRDGNYQTVPAILTVRPEGL